MTRILVIILAAILGVAGALFGALAYSRAQLPYNEEGRYFDASEGVAYRADSVLAYGIIAGVFLLLAIGVFALTLITKAKH